MVKNMTPEVRKRRLAYYKMKLEGTTGATRLFGEILRMQIILWQDKNMYLHPSRWSPTKKSRYGDLYREHMTMTEYMEAMMRVYTE